MVIISKGCFSGLQFVLFLNYKTPSVRLREPKSLWTDFFKFILTLMSVASNVFCIEFQLDLESLCSSD